MKAFSSVEKTEIRQFDLDLITELSIKAKRRLSYLGLPSPEMGDISAWRPYLTKIFAIEKKKRYLSHLIDRAYNLGFVNNLTYFWGDIDVIFESGFDNYGHSVVRTLPVDLINLDYCYGLDYRGFQKLSTLEYLIVRQKESLLKNPVINLPYFLIFLTHNLPLREGNPKAKKDYMNLLTQDARYYDPALKQQVVNTRNWYLSDKCPPAYQHKCFVIDKLLTWAHQQGFKAVPERIIQYFGDKNAMMLHYQFRVTPVNLDSPVPAKNQMSKVEVLNYPVVNCQNEDIEPNRPIIRA